MQQAESQAKLSSTTSINNFIPLEKIGEGSFSSVYKVRRINDDQIYALKKVKMIALKQKQKQNALNEIRILASLASQYIIEYKEAFFDERLNLLCIVMEQANQGDLQKKIQSFRKNFCHFPEKQIWKAAAHIIQGLYSLHSKLILHRDIKSANIFVSNGVYKLGDLNVSKIQKNCDRLAYTQTGTPYYASPEVWRDQPYDSKSDIWSLGCIIYEICNFKPPFKGKDLESLYKTVQKGSYQPISPMYSKQLSQLIGLCLRKNPKQRLSTQQLLVPYGVLAQKCREYGIHLNNNQIDPTLLKTIKLPMDLKELKKKLPKSKYQKTSVKEEFKSISKKFSYVPIKQTYEPSQISKKRSNVSIDKTVSSKSIEGNPQNMRKRAAIHIKSQKLIKNIEKGNTSITERKEKYPECIRKYSQERNKNILKQINEIRKLSQPDRCFSQRYLQSQQKLKKNKDSSTDRKIQYKKSQQSLIDLEKKLNLKRKQLRKIGSIQKITTSKQSNSYCYRNHNPHIKKSAVHASNILIKSPTSTEADQVMAEQKYPKRIELGKLNRIKPLQKVNSTPYIIGLSDAPRMKKILEGMQNHKKSKQLELKGKLGHKYISQISHKY